MSRRPGPEVYRPASDAPTAMLPTLRRAARTTAPVVPEQTIGGRDAGGAIGGLFSLPGFADPRAAATPGPVAGGRRRDDPGAGECDGCG